MSRAIRARKYTPETIADTSKLVQNCSIPLNTASKVYGIPKSTLKDFVLSFLRDEVQDQDLLTDPSRLYNADETGFPLCPKGGKVLSMKGAKHVYNYTSNNKSQMTVLACVSAVRHYIKPLIVYLCELFRKNV
ncbi:hypothetical protein DPMN_090169 [Dreissena polymorpha]|uniref:Uncharacterized protein n=1 Tax=Dreissena polymorpha TaxID=45954 RepID=A0A9D4KX83_DREPO|nr:hypothetical protein DPMN_090169 [Dreissena polymorpha]